ncbi:MAG: hypothetical protein Q8M11_19930 [Sulfuritalea sp.]|nr:hypothetical protein [Sulfuritalea sp.]MDP1981006.1 hypothetical protein [Sulfuritalea sp.]
MTGEEIVKLVGVLSWPCVVLIIFFTSRTSLISFLSQYGHVEFAASAIKLTLKRLEVEYNVPKTQIKKLQGLTGHDLWALDAFVKRPDDSFKYVSRFTPTRKAMVFSFIEMGLLEVVGQGSDRYVQPTQLASDVIEAANKLM